MSRWYDSADELGHGEIFDPLCIERSAPMEDTEAELVEALCHAATPGPLVIDDEAQGEGAVVVSLPDGRLIVSLTAPVEHTQQEGVNHANAELVCKARYLLLRLLRDRRRWKEEREFLLARIRTLEAALKIEDGVTVGKGWGPVSEAPSRPR
jgi:hypothetical protein